mmetsp:Transcript_2366/g.8584  ORF Transcript_2366/g.8584 Transcript_2366/m.8584 type:complete len:210 (+) Transcript_2366:30-659(+)
MDVACDALQLSLRSLWATPLTWSAPTMATTLAPSASCAASVRAERMDAARTSSRASITTAPMRPKRTRPPRPRKTSRTSKPSATWPSPAAVGSAGSSAGSETSTPTTKTVASAATAVVRRAISLRSRASPKTAPKMEMDPSPPPRAAKASAEHPLRVVSSVTPLRSETWASVSTTGRSPRTTSISFKSAYFSGRRNSSPGAKPTSWTTA